MYLAQSWVACGCQPLVQVALREMKYLIRNRGQKQKAHIWLGTDTECRMASTGGLKLSRFDVHDSPNSHEICWMCAKGQGHKPKKRKNSKQERKLQSLLRAPGEVFYESKPWKKLRIKVIATYGRRCMRCDRTDGEMHVDHIKPRSKAPELSLAFENLQVLCRDCNMKKWNYHATDYRESSAERELDRLALQQIPQNF